jgi:hypothetical protein
MKPLSTHRQGFIVLQIAILIIAFSAYSTRAIAQKVYKCSGNNYSQVPCPDAATLDPADRRTAEQKAQADANTVRTRATADQMENDRLKLEREALAGQNTAPAPKSKAKLKTPHRTEKKASPTDESPGSVPVSRELSAKKHKGKKKQPEFFTASPPAEPAATKSTNPVKRKKSE